MKKNLKNLVRIKEKRTFVLNALCECGGEFAYDLSDFGDIFSTLFQSSNGEDKGVFKHKCRKCGKTATFKHIFPSEKTFEIGLDTPSGDIADYVVKAFEEELEDATGYSTSIEV